MTFLVVERDGAMVTHYWACSQACVARLTTKAPAREVQPPAQVKRCAGCGQSIGGGPRR